MKFWILPHWNSTYCINYDSNDDAINNESDELLCQKFKKKGKKATLRNKQLPVGKVLSLWQSEMIFLCQMKCIPHASKAIIFRNSNQPVVAFLDRHSKQYPNLISGQIQTNLSIISLLTNIKWLLSNDWIESAMLVTVTFSFILANIISIY